MDKLERLHRLVGYLAEVFSGGNSSVSNEDEIADGVNVQIELEKVTQSFTDAELAQIGADGVMEALVTLSDAWGQGYELASGDDLVNDDNETVRDIVCEYHDELTSTLAGPSPR